MDDRMKRRLKIVSLIAAIIATLASIIAAVVGFVIWGVPAIMAMSAAKVGQFLALSGGWHFSRVIKDRRQKMRKIKQQTSMAVNSAGAELPNNTDDAISGINDTLLEVADAGNERCIIPQAIDNNRKSRTTRGYDFARRLIRNKRKD